MRVTCRRKLAFKGRERRPITDLREGMKTASPQSTSLIRENYAYRTIELDRLIQPCEPASGARQRCPRGWLRGRIRAPLHRGPGPNGEQSPGIRAAIDNGFELLANDDYGGPHPACKLTPDHTDASGEETWQSLLLDYNHLIAFGSGARERQFNDQDNELESPGYSSSMGRLTSQNRTAQIEPVPDNPSTLPVADRQPETSASGLHKNQLAAWMDAHALTRSSQHCAMYCRLGLEAAGLSTQDRPRSGDAGDYGPFLLRHGAQVVAADSYTPQLGDTVVFDKTAQHPYGHIEMYDGQRWVSDFMQHSFSPYRDYASTPPFTIYRLT